MDTLVMEQTRLQENIARWSFYDPYAKNLNETFTCKRLFIHRFDGGENLIEETSTETVYYHTKETPIKEARAWFEELDLTDVEVLYVYGVGLGYYYEPVKQWLREKEGRYLVFFEDDLEVIYRLFQTERGTELIGDHQVRLYHIPHIQERDFLRAVSDTFSDLAFTVSALHYYSRARSHLLSQIKAMISYASLIKGISFFERVSYGKSFFRNFYENTGYLPESSLGDGLFGKFQGIPAIICGAGPSLEKNIHTLKKLKDRALIFAGGTSMNALNAEDLLPHFGAGIDPNWHQYTRLIMNKAYEVPFFYRSRMYHEAFRLIHGPRLYMSGEEGYPVPDWFEEQLGIEGVGIEGGHNVVNTCLSLAHAMGCNPIIFVGVDLAYSKNQSYASGVINHPVHSLKKDFQTKTEQDELVEKLAINGERVYTVWKWIAESNWFASYTMKNPDAILVNATEGGIGFPGVPNIPLTEVAASFLKNTYDLEGMVHGEIQNHPLPESVTLERVTTLLETFHKSVQACDSFIVEMIKDLKKTQASSSEGKEVPASLLSKEGFKILEAFNKEPAYRYLLCSFSDFYNEHWGRRVFDFQPPPPDVLEKEKIQFHIHRYKFLKKAVEINLKCIEEALSGHRDRLTLKAITQETNTLPKAPTDLEYVFDGKRLFIHDPALGLTHEESFVPERISQKKKPDKEHICAVDASGNPHGESLYFYPNGAIRIEQFYLHGKLHGPSTFFSENGDILGRHWFLHGIRQGRGWKYYPSQALYTLQGWREDMLEGVQLYYYPDGTVKSVLNYQKGILHGEVILFHPNGQKARHLHYYEGQRDGTEWGWNQHGLQLIEAHYKRGVPQGTARTWHPTGHLAREAVYDPETGKATIRRWNQDGCILVSRPHETDYFESITSQTSVLTGALDNVYNVLGTVAPMLDKENVSQGIQEDLDALQSEMVRLKEMDQEMTKLIGDENEWTQEPIWKTPASRKQVRQQLESATEQMHQGLEDIREALRVALEQYARSQDTKKDDDDSV